MNNKYSGVYTEQFLRCSFLFFLLVKSNFNFYKNTRALIQREVLTHTPSPPPDCLLVNEDDKPMSWFLFSVLEKVLK